MKSFFAILAFVVTAPLMASAASSYYLCGSMAHAEEAVKEKLNVSPSDASVHALYGADETLAGGQYVYRKILVNIQSAHSASIREMVVSYTIIQSYDGPDNGNDCFLNAIEYKQDVCKRRPELSICH